MRLGAETKLEVAQAALAAAEAKALEDAAVARVEGAKEAEEEFGSASSKGTPI